MAAITKLCNSCNQPFEFSTREQFFYREHNLADPKKCFNCRQAEKRRRQAMNDKPQECYSCKEGYVRGVITDADHKCLDCGRVIEKSGLQYPVVRGAQEV